MIGKKLKVGVIGLGIFGEIQVKLLKQFINVELVGVSSRTEKRVKEISKKYDIRNTYTDYRELIKNKEIDAVFIVSSAERHKEQALYAIKSGKHVFLEKPPALTFEDTQEIIRSAEKADIFLMTGYILRFDPKCSIIKKYLEDGLFGDIIYMKFKRNSSYHWLKGNEKKDFNPISEALSHDIDLALWYTNSKVNEVYAKQFFTEKDMDFPSACLAIISFENNLVVTFETNWQIPKMAPVNLLMQDGTLDADLEIIGTKMTAKSKLMDHGLTLWSDKRILHPDVSLWPEINERIEGALRSEVLHFIECITKDKNSNIISNKDAVYGMKICNAMMESASKNEVITLD